MTARDVKNEAYLPAPIIKNAADTTGEKGVIRYAGSTSSQSATVPTAMRGAECIMLSQGTYAQWGVVLEGDTAPTLVIDQAAAFGTGHASAGGTLLQDQPTRVVFPPNARTIVWISKSATNTFFECRLAGRKKGR